MSLRRLVMLLALALAACSSGGDDLDGGPNAEGAIDSDVIDSDVIDSGAIAADMLDGSWEFADGEDDDGALEIIEESDEPFVFEIDVTVASMRATDQCQTVFGSLTATADGAATFTIPGSTTAPCSGALETEHLRIVAALEAVTSWAATPPGLELRGPDQVRLAFRPAG